VEIFRVILQLVAVLVNVGIAFFAYRIWHSQQKKLRESHAAQEAIEAQISFRIKAGTSMRNVWNNFSVLYAGENSGRSEAIELLSEYVGELEEKYIMLSQKLSVCKMLWGEDVKKIIDEYDTCYNDLLAIVSVLFSGNVKRIGDSGEEIKNINDIITKMNGLECNYDIVRKHLI